MPTFYGKPNPPAFENMGKAWKDEELIQLLKEVKMKMSIDTIAKAHKRTTGGITSRLRSLAADYYCNDDMPVDQIMVITGLPKDSIIDAISKREYQNELKEKKAEMKVSKKKEYSENIEDYVLSKVLPEVPKKREPELPDLKEILALLKSIDKKVTEYIQERTLFEKD